jgi:class 3 adenylate cyclase/tetratricopeptide (TPR) repeat protein
MEQGEAADLGAYLPVVQARWLADAPEQTWREVEGSLVFADISGFTPLTERLARLGKVGAEELTATLNRVFGVLLGIAEEHGGDLLKHGGDALLLLFEGQGHAEQACAAAAGMQKGLRAFRRLRTDAGVVSLKMSVGVASGTIQLFLVGGSHRELLAAGPTISEVAAMEAAADADEVLLGPGAAALVPAVNLGREKAGGWLLKGVPVVVPAPLVRVPRPGSELGVPVALREHLRSGQEEGEHRLAVLTFLQFKGTDDLLREQGPAAVAAALDQLVRTVQEACERHGASFLATDLDRNGGKVLLVAGAPLASTDDEDRTLHTLLEVMAQPLTLSVRAGVNRGRSFAVDVGSSTRRTYAVMGDATNLAARVMGKAEPGGIVATADVLRRVSTDFAVTVMEPFMVKGKSMPIDAGVVGAARGRRKRQDVQLPLVGRDAELAVLQGALDGARAGHGQVVELVGGAGLGKSRLLDELRHLAGSEMLQLVIEGAAYGVHSPYFALRAPLLGLLGAPPHGPDDAVLSTLEKVLSERAPDLLPWVPLLALPLGLELPNTPQTAELDPAFRATKLRMVVVELLGRLLDRPAVILIDDAHLLDVAGSDLLGGLLQTAPSRPWVICTSRRDTPGGLVAPAAPGTTSLQVATLAEEATRALLRQAAQDDPVPAAVMVALAERSGGNPLFLQELLSVARSGGSVDQLPDSVEAVVAARIDELPARDKALLRHASVLGSRFSGSLLEQLVPPDDQAIEVRLRRLDAFLVRTESGDLRFRHAMLREAAYEGLPFRRRRALHSRAGELIEARAGGDLDEWCDLLSLHYSAAQRHEPAWTFSRMAGDRARRLAGPADAAVFYQRAVEAAAGLPGSDPLEIARTYEALGDVCEVSAQYDKAARAYARARQLGHRDRLLVVELCRKEGRLRERSASYSEALRWYSKGISFLEGLANGRPVQQARAQLSLAYGIGRLRQGRYRQAIPHLEAAAREAAVLGDLPTLGHAYYVLDWAHTDLGNDDAHHYRELALMIFKHLGDLNRQANVYNNLGIDAYYEGRWDEALELYERSREAWERSGDVAQMGTAANNIGEILSDQGRFELAATQFDEALFVWRAARFPVGIALASSNLGRLAVRRGDHEAGARWLGQAKAAFQEIGAESFVLEVDAREAERLVLTGAGAGALALIEATSARANDLGGMAMLLAMLDRLAGCALAQAGDAPAAVDRLRTSLGRCDADYEVALTLQVLARLGADAGPAGPADPGRAADDLLGGLGVVATLDLPLCGTCPQGSRQGQP